VRTSNAGQLLFTGLPAADRAAAVASSLLRPQSFSGWGIRTVAQGEARYNPMSYHNGSIWPHDNALIALGFARYGLKRPVGRLFQGLFDAATYLELRRLPELFCGFQRQRERGPTLYPVACSPQAWAVQRHSRCSRLRSAWSSIDTTMRFDCGTPCSPRSSMK
jgi:glycogen debranching enzyme